MKLDVGNNASQLQAKGVKREVRAEGDSHTRVKSTMAAKLATSPAALGAQLMRSAEIARLAGVSADSLRHYERVGVLTAPQRTAAGYRLYAPSALDRARLVRRALSFGFSLRELARIFRVRDKGGIPCRQARSLGRAKLADLERQIVELEVLRAQLKDILRLWDRKLRRTPRNARAHLLESLPASLANDASRPASSRKFSPKRGRKNQ
jgi:DNA-binding transcriptional MerR regulator